MANSDNIKKGSKVYSSNRDGEIIEHEVVAAGSKYITIKGNSLREYKVVRDTMLSDTDRGHKTEYFASREELVEKLAKESAWNELSKIVSDRHSAPKDLTSAKILAAVNALKGE